MKHNTKITAILVLMFIVTQLIGLFVIQVYTQTALPYGMEPPKEIQPEAQGTGFLVNILIAFAFAVFVLFLLTKVKAEWVLRIWFFGVIILAIALTLNALFFKSIGMTNLKYLALALAVPLAYFKVFKRNILVHNATELLVYPGIAAVFASILGVLGIIILLLAISLYDIWAVWHSGFMQKMAKFQINTLKVFGGFFVPYADKKQKQKIQLIKDKYKNKNLEKTKLEKMMDKDFKRAKVKVHLAILGGGDVIFPIITAGIFYKAYGIVPALIITASATLGLLYLLIASKKGKFYPAMPYLTIAMYLGMALSWLIV